MASQCTELFRLRTSDFRFKNFLEIHTPMVANIERVVVLVVLFCICEGVAPAQTSPDVSTPMKRAAVSFPDLAIVNSRLNQEFRRRYTIYQRDNPGYFSNSEWPMELARESQTACEAQIERENKIEREKQLADKSQTLPKTDAAPINRQAITGSMDIESHFEISAPSDYIVKFINDKGKCVATIYLAGGHKTKVHIPPGTYILRYATNVDMYSSLHRFGPQTKYGEITTYLSVRREGGYGIGSAISLGVGNGSPTGNLPAQTISASDF
jgi:hypothetical protein